MTHCPDSSFWQKQNKKGLKAPLIDENFTIALLVLIGKKTLGFECSHTSGAGGGNCLAINFILNVASCKHARYFGCC